MNRIFIKWYLAFFYVVLVCEVVVWWTFCGYDSKYFYYPTHPVATTFQTVPYEVKSRIVYITKEDEAWIHLLKTVLFVLGSFIAPNLVVNVWWPFIPVKQTEITMKNFDSMEAEHLKKTHMFFAMTAVMALVAILITCGRFFGLGFSK